MRFVALWLFGLCILMFGFQGLGFTETVILDKSVVWSEPWRLLTAMFAHANAGHLLSNLFALGLFGLILEGAVGPKRVLWLFLLSGLAINIASPYPRSLGASGAIFALTGAVVALRPTMTIWFSGIPMPMVVAGVIYLIQDIVGAFVPNGVANLAHIAGLIIGLVAGLMWRQQNKAPTKKKKPINHKLEIQIDEWMDRQGTR